MSFNEFIGNEDTKTQIKSFFNRGKIPHALIIEGAEGLGKRTLAHLISKACVCENNYERPCCNCTGCKKVDRGVHPDVIYPEKSGALETYNIDTIRKMREDAYIVANEANYKVYILTNVDNMGIPAQNALLKILEEPPINVVFILTCVSSMNLLETIRSRMQILSLMPVSFDDAILYIKRKYEDISIDEIDKAVRLSEGNIGISIDILTSVELKECISLANEMAIAIISPRPFELLKATSGLNADRKKFKKVLGFLIGFLRKALVLSYINENDTHNNAIFNDLSSNLNADKIIALIEEINKTLMYAEQNVNSTLLSTNLCANVQSIVF